MRRFGLALAVAGAVVMAAPAASASDVLVWRADGDGFVTSWVVVEGGDAKVIATRDELVTAGSGALEAVRWKHVKRTGVACNPDDPDEESTYQLDWPGVALVGLVGGTERWLVDPTPSEPGDRIWGDIWNEETTLKGGAGRYLTYYHAHSGYECGAAHGYQEDTAITADLTDRTRGVVPDTLLADAEATNAEPVRRLYARAEEEGCVDGADPSNISLDGIEIRVVKGKLSAVLVHIYPTEVDWAFNCTLFQDTPVPWSTFVPAFRPSADVERAVSAAVKRDGIVGWSLVTLTEDARAKALKAFEAPVPGAPKRSRATAEAQKLIDKGRKLTKAKKYPEAIAAFDDAIAKDRDAARAWSGRGYAKLLAGRLLEASRDFDHAAGLDENPDFQGAVWYNIGQIAEKRGEVQQARAAYTRSLKVRPSKAVEKALKALKKK